LIIHLNNTLSPDFCFYDRSAYLLELSAFTLLDMGRDKSLNESGIMTPPNREDQGIVEKEFLKTSIESELDRHLRKLKFQQDKGIDLLTNS
jgi:hypothetical protein